MREMLMLALELYLYPSSNHVIVLIVWIMGFVSSSFSRFTKIDKQNLLLRYAYLFF